MFEGKLAGTELTLETPDALPIEVLSLFYGQCFEAEFSEYQWTNAAERIVEYGYSGEAASDILINIPADSTGIVATKDRRVLATIAFAQRSGYVYVWGMYVYPALKRQGIGRVLMHHVMSMADPEEILEVFVLRENTGASHFYRSLGLVHNREFEGEVCPGVPALMDVFGNRISRIYPVVA